MNSGSSRSGSGASSILVIITVVAMTVFGVLALVTVQTENRLTNKTTDVFTARYEADAEAQHTLALIDEALYESTTLTELSQRLADIGGVSLSEDGTTITIEQPVDDNIILVIILGNLRLGEQSERYTIWSYKQINIKEWNPDSAVNVWQGEETE